LTNFGRIGYVVAAACTGARERRITTPSRKEIRRVPRVTKLVFVVVICVLLLSIAVFFFVRRRNQLAKLTAEAPAQVLSVSVDTDRSRTNNRRRTSYKTNISYRYTVNGTTHAGQTSKSGDVKSSYEQGRSVKVCYEPAHPQNSEIFTGDHRCGG